MRDVGLFTSRGARGGGGVFLRNGRRQDFVVTVHESRGRGSLETLVTKDRCVRHSSCPDDDECRPVCLRLMSLDLNGTDCTNKLSSQTNNWRSLVYISGVPGPVVTAGPSLQTHVSLMCPDVGPSPTQRTTMDLVIGETFLQSRHPLHQVGPVFYFPYFDRYFGESVTAERTSF